jgi:hypothetical protein
LLDYYNFGKNDRTTWTDKGQGSYLFCASIRHIRYKKSGS